MAIRIHCEFYLSSNPFTVAISSDYLLALFHDVSSTLRDQTNALYSVTIGSFLITEIVIPNFQTHYVIVCDFAMSESQ